MPAWDQAREDELSAYTLQLHERLQGVKCPATMLQCQDPMCSDISHSEKRDATVLDILSAIVETSHTCLPLTGRTGGSQKQDREVIPGWSTEVEPQRQRSNY